MHHFFIILTLIFVVAKILGYIAWSWWIVFLPIVPATVFWIFLLIIIASVKRKVTKRF